MCFSILFFTFSSSFICHFYHFHFFLSLQMFVSILLLPNLILDDIDKRTVSINVRAYCRWYENPIKYKVSHTIMHICGKWWKLISDCVHKLKRTIGGWGWVKYDAFNVTTGDFMLYLFSVFFCLYRIEKMSNK